MIIHDIKNPALTIEQALDNLQELIGVNESSEDGEPIQRSLACPLPKEKEGMKHNSERVEGKENIEQMKESKDEKAKTQTYNIQVLPDPKEGKLLQSIS